MERIGAVLVRWGSALSLFVIIGYFVAQAIDVTPSDGVGVEMGMAIVAAVALLLLGLLVSIGTFVLWYARISKHSELSTRFENERIIGTAFLVVFSVAAFLFI